MKKIFGYLSITVLLFACSADPELGPIITIDNAEIGAFPRLLELTSGEYDLANLNTSAYQHILDFRSENGGENVVEYRVFVSHVDNDDSNGDQSVDEQLYRTYTTSDFTVNPETGNLGMTINFPFAGISDDLGIDINAISPGDFFQFRSELILDDDRVFSQSNTNATINGPAFGALFNWRVNATCPLPDDLFVGDYTLSYDLLDGNGFGESLVPGTVTLRTVNGSTTLREFDAVILDVFGGFAVTPRMDFICEIVAMQTVNCNVGCGSPNIFIRPADDAPQDITDDSVIVVNYTEDGGACGYSALRTMRLVKNN